ncbi:DNA polymerase III subunit gamma/tau [Mycoplasma phocoeninasale]|uniref:DNA polymerase III subunit gamma/tau n=1 Tax=Mycoplasma phocoeninasale TaxID=2726117 RepID=A0A858U547_9MOLU|nr:DNA polymerase III subunit gamma/tau [Mycoplasma phocoeninasale]QJG66547.1 DNA polymerase III subunit gamma/tau [Mycoplasma phocoeninasale]
MSLSDKYLALYRQYRPQKFEDIKGQEHIVRTLKNIILNHKIGHAYLFCGPHGNGKTSTAKVFANTINCGHTEDILVPCQQCIANIDRNLDIIEIDAASNTGIDDIRELREKVKHMPTNSKYKIYIIDEVHMLSKGAFNALLKTLEEPPEYVIFILATTDPQKIPLTILSRVQRFNFKKMELSTLVSELKKIFEKEQIGADEDAIQLISKLGNGSFRDTLSLADQIAIYCANEKITKGAVEDLFAISNSDNIIKLINLAASNNLEQLLLFSNDLLEKGTDIVILLNQIVDILKDFIIYKKTNSMRLVEELTEESLKKITIDNISHAYEFLDIILISLKELKYSDFPKQTFELCLMKMAKSDRESKDTNLKVRNDYASEDNFKPVNKVLKKTSLEQEELNSKFNLSSIANTFSEKKELVDLNIEEVNVDEILEKTAEILLSETTNELENAQISDAIVTSNYDVENTEVQSSAKNDEPVGSDTVSLDQIIDCLLVKQYAKMAKPGYENANLTLNDNIKYSLIDSKLSDSESDKQVKDILSNFKIIFSSHDFILFSSSFDDKVFDLNRNAYRDSLIKGAYKIFNRYVHLFAITEKQIEDAKNYWLNNKEALKSRKIKKLEDLSKRYDESSASIDWAMETFGEKFKIKK